MNPFSLTSSTLVLFDFSQRTLEDFSGNGLDLSGTHSFREVSPQVWELAPGSDVARPVRDAALALTGEITIEATGRMYSAAGLFTLVAFLASGETLATNVQWLLGTQDASRLRWLQEFGSTGTDAPASPLSALSSNETLPAPGCDFHYAGTRYADGSVALFVNGRLHARSAPLTTPTGGTSAVLRVMAGATAFGLRGVRIRGVSMTPEEIADSAEACLGVAPAPLTRTWIGALTDTSVAIVKRLLPEGVTRTDVTGLEPDTEYDLDGVTVRTLPEAGQPCDFKIAFSGDAVVGSTAPVFNAILQQAPRMFIHMGDLHYQNISTNNQASFHAAFDAVFASATQHRLYRSIPTAYVWDDHDFGGNNSDGTSASKPAAASVYRSRVPHYPLAHATAIYQTWDIGRVRFIMTDQRSEASVNTATDNSSKTMLGATQKSWFKNLIANSPGMLIVWVCPRWFANANHVDSWNSFSTERAELVDHIKANAHGRVVVLSADQHYLGLDDGTNVDHATGGGEPLPTFQAAPLDQTPSALGGTWTDGNFNPNGAFGTMQVEDSGGSTIDVTWRAHDSTGAVLSTLAFSVSV